MSLSLLDCKTWLMLSLRRFFSHSEGLNEKDLFQFAGTVTILFTFCFAACVVLINHGNGLIAIDWVRSKPIVVIAGESLHLSFLTLSISF